LQFAHASLFDLPRVGSTEEIRGEKEEKKFPAYREYNGAESRIARYRTINGDFFNWIRFREI